MIVFDLTCADSGDVFEAWFQSGQAFEDQKAKGLVQCPFCHSSRIEKAPMAPRVPSRAGTAERAKAAMAELAQAQARMLRDSQWVGDEFATTARAMHSGDVEPRPVHGQASAREARSLVADGVPVMPLAFPVAPPDQVN